MTSTYLWWILVRAKACGHRCGQAMERASSDEVGDSNKALRQSRLAEVTYTNKLVAHALLFR